jgi:DNA-binding SARP family transcriptional activator/DNA-binding beta-propeller fold protein YncE
VRYRGFTNTLEFRVLGPLQVATNGTSLPLGGAKQRAVLVLLLLHANEVVPTDRLIDELWGDSPPESAANIVQGYVSHLRKALEPGRRRGEHELLISHPRGYALQIGKGQLDAERCSGLIEQGRRRLSEGDPGAAAECLRAALALWRGPPLADLAYEPFARAEIDRLEELRLAGLEERIDADLALGRHHDLVGELRELVAEHPLRERFRGQLMAALYRCGRQAEALEVYRDGRRALSDELGLEPGPALRELERAILQQDQSLGAPAPPPRPTASRLSRRWLLAVVVAVAGGAVAATLTRGGSGKPASVVVYPHSVAAIDPASNTIVADILVGGYPGPLAADDRFVYVCNIGDATVSRILPAAKRVFDTFSFSRATDLVAVDGHLWAANGGSPGHTPLGVPPGTILHYAPGPTLKAIAVGPSRNGPEEQTTIATDGSGFSIWAGNQDSETVRQIDASLGTTLLTIHGVAPGGLAAVGSSTSDTVWASDPLRNLVLRIDEQARRITRRIAIPGRPTRLAADRRAVWVAARGPSRALWRIDPSTNKVVARIPLPVTPRRVALGAGAVWVTGYRHSNRGSLAEGGQVIRIDPGTNRIVKQIPLGDSAADGIIVSHGLVWVAVPPTA